MGIEARLDGLPTKELMFRVDSLEERLSSKGIADQRLSYRNLFRKPENYVSHNASRGRCKTLMVLEGERYPKWVMHYRRLMRRPQERVENSILPRKC